MNNAHYSSELKPIKEDVNEQEFLPGSNISEIDIDTSLDED